MQGLEKVKIYKNKQRKNNRKNNCNKRRAEVADLTAFVDGSDHPEGTRFIVRREPLHPGAQRSLFPSQDYRYWGHWTDSTDRAVVCDQYMRAHAHVEDTIGRIKNTGGNRFCFR